MRTKWIPRSGLAALLALAATGCFVGDEMDKAAKLDNSFSAPGAKVVAKTAGAADSADAKAKPGAKPAAAAANASGKPAVPSGDAWWKTASSVTSEESSSSIAKCNLKGHIEFMQHDDCLARGGKTE